jgi:predicted ribosome quality control (RQC) complex YloA/Tae2 family protein
MKTFAHIIGDIEYTIKVGSNAKENWYLIDNSYPEDLWFHLDEYPSAHVIISQQTNNSNDIFYPNQIIGIGADYCKSYSKYGKNLHKAKIVLYRNKKFKKGKEVGQVIISKPNYFII